MPKTVKLKKIVQEGDKVLREISKEVKINDITSTEIKNLIKDMSAVLESTSNGVALAAPQIGINLRVFIADAGQLPPNRESLDEKRTRGPYLVFINPVILKQSRKSTQMSEGCLSVENIYGSVKRSDKLTVEAHDEHGKKFQRGASGLLAQIIQHETDHLHGKLFIDKATDLTKIDPEKK